jgi:hypothetical protein
MHTPIFQGTTHGEFFEDFIKDLLPTLSPDLPEVPT